MSFVTVFVAVLAFGLAPPLRVTRGVAVPPTPRAVPPPLVLGTENAETLHARQEPAIVAGLGGNDVVMTRHPESQLAGGAGFDILLPRAGAKRVTAGPDGGVVFVGGSTGASVVVESGLNLVVGSEGPDQVKIWGGINFIAGMGGDDTIEVRGPTLSFVWTGPGSDSICTGRSGAFVLGKMLIETKTPCPSDFEVGDDVHTEVVGILSNHRSVVVRRGAFTMDDPEHRGSPEQEFAMEVLGVLLGPDPGPSNVYRPGGVGQFSDGREVTETSVGGSKWPRLGEALHIMLRANTWFEDPDNAWLFDFLPPGMPHVGTAVPTTDGIVEPFASSTAPDSGR